MNNVEREDISHLPRPSRRTRRFYDAQYLGFMRQFRSMLQRVADKKTGADIFLVSTTFERAIFAMRVKYHKSRFDLDSPTESQ